MLPSTRSSAARPRALLRASAVLLLGGLACGDDPLAPACSDPVDMQVSGGLPPVISWTPDCSVERLSAVAPPSLGVAATYWSIAAGDQRIESGVRFGRLPRGAVEESPPSIVMSGARVAIQVESPRGTTIGAVTWTAP